MSNKITAYFKGRTGVAEAVYQNDYGIVMEFDGIYLPAHFDCYFSVPGSSASIAAVGADNRVAIPNSVLAKSGKMEVHIPLHTGFNDSEVEYVAYFKVIGRARPEDDGTPAQMTAIEQALALLQTPIGNIEQIVNKALSFTGETFDEMQADLDEWKDDTEGSIDTWKDGVEDGLNTWKDGVEDGLDTWKSGVESDFDNLEAQFDTAVAAVTTDTEVTDIRVGADGVTDTTAGASVRRQFTDLKADLAPLLASENIWSLSGYIENGYITSSGTRSANSSWRMIYMLPVENITNIHLHGYYADMATSTYNITAWNADKEYIGGVWRSQSYTQLYEHEAISLPQGTAYICVATALNMIDKCYLYVSPWADGKVGALTDLTTRATKNIVSAINENKDNIDILSAVNNLWEMTGYIINGFVDSTGGINTNSSWRMLYMIPVRGISTLYLKGYYADITLANTYNVTAFDVNKNYLGGVWASGSYQTYYELEQVNLPSNTAYVCITTALNMIDKCIVFINPWANGVYNLLESFTINKSFSAFLKFGVVGDSLSVGYTGNDDQRNIEYSWGRVMGRKYGTTCLNFGKSGATTKSWFTDSYCYTEIVKSENKCQAYIVGIGTNDTIDSSFPIGSSSDIDLSDSSNNADSFYGWYGKIIQTIISVNPTAKIFCFTIPYPRVDTDKNTAISTICSLFSNVYLVDLAGRYNELFENENITSFAHAGHFSPGGYANLADINMYVLSETMKNNASDFTEIDDIPYGNATIVN